jgi:hypothetical protein
MTITLKRQLTDDEKEHILKVHGRKCWATGHLIPEDEPVHSPRIPQELLKVSNSLARQHLSPESVKVSSYSVPPPRVL